MAVSRGKKQSINSQHRSRISLLLHPVRVNALSPRLQGATSSPPPPHPRALGSCDEIPPAPETARAGVSGSGAPSGTGCVRAGPGPRPRPVRTSWREHPRPYWPRQASRGAGGAVPRLPPGRLGLPPSRPAPARFMTTKWVVRKSCGSDYVRKVSLPARRYAVLFWRFFSFVRNWPDFERYAFPRICGGPRSSRFG